MEQGLKQSIKNIYFNAHGRFSRETFVVTFTTLFLLSIITPILLYKLCSFLLPAFITVLLVILYVIYMIYAYFVIHIKRLHDFNLTGWYSLLILVPFLNVFFMAYCLLKKGDSKDNNYGAPLDYIGPPAILFASYIILVLTFGTSGYFYILGHKLRTAKTNTETVEILAKLLPKKLKSFKNQTGVVFINDQFSGSFAVINKNRIVVQGTEVKRTIQSAINQNKKVGVRLLDNSTANITRFIASDDAPSVQMSVFELDRTIGVPGKFNEKNRAILKRINIDK